MTDEDDPWPHEPDTPGSPEDVGEPDPEADLGPEIPEVEVPEAPDFSETEASEGVVRSFWKLVAIFNVALFAASLGPMLIVFRGEWINGGAVFVLGVAFLFYGYVRYLRAKEQLADDA